MNRNLIVGAVAIGWFGWLWGRKGRIKRVVAHAQATDRKHGGRSQELAHYLKMLTAARHNPTVLEVGHGREHVVIPAPFDSNVKSICAVFQHGQLDRMYLEPHD